MEPLSLTPREVYEGEHGWVVEGFCHQRGQDMTVPLERVQSLLVMPKLLRR